MGGVFLDISGKDSQPSLGNDNVKLRVNFPIPLDLLTGACQIGLASRKSPLATSAPPEALLGHCAGA